jgi:hypothetical protein
MANDLWLTIIIHHKITRSYTFYGIWLLKKIRSRVAESNACKKRWKKWFVNSYFHRFSFSF